MMTDDNAPEREDLTSWRTNRAKGWTKDLGYVIQDQLRRHDYLIGRKGEKPDDPGWNECRCGWEGYWSGFHPHVADHIREALLSAHPTSSRHRPSATTAGGATQ